MKTIRDILRSRNGDVWSVSTASTVLEALKVMGDKGIGALVVKGPAGEVAGIISERDYARKVILVGKTSASTLVEEIMTPADRMIVARSGSTLDECMALLTNNNIRHLPVFEGPQFVGIISSRDVIQMLLAEKADRLDHLYGRLDEMR